MIGVENHFVYKFSLGGEDDFILDHDLVEFTMVEEAGNVLPTWEIGFTTVKESILNLMNETKVFEVSFGKNIDDMVTVPLSIKSKTILRQGNTKRLINANGTISVDEYLSSSKVSISSEKSAIEVLKEKVEKYFNWHKDNISKSNDSQKWIQPSTTDKSFVNELWMHSDLGDGIPVVGITSEGDFICKDLKSEGSKPYKYKFTYNPIDNKKDISYDGDYVVEDETTFINNWVGYGREKHIYNLEEGTTTTDLETFKPVVAMTQQIAKNASVEKKYTKVGMHNENTHPTYWQSYQNNLRSLASMSAVKISLSHQGYYVPLKVLDQVMFSDDDVEHGSGSITSGPLTGLYFVSKVARTVSNNQLATVVEIVRESLNDVKVG